MTVESGAIIKACKQVLREHGEMVEEYKRNRIYGNTVEAWRKTIKHDRKIMTIRTNNMSMRSDMVCEYSKALEAFEEDENEVLQEEIRAFSEGP